MLVIGCVRPTCRQLIMKRSFKYDTVRYLNQSGWFFSRHKHLFKTFKLDSIPKLPYHETIELSYQQYKPSKTFEIDTNLSPIVMLHGFLGSKQNYGTVARHITQLTRHPVYGVDMRNHGQSMHAGPHDYYHLALDVIKVLQDKNWNDAILVGHSMGAKVAMIVGLLEPELLSKIIVIDNSPVSSQLDESFEKDVVGMCHVEYDFPNFINKSPTFQASKVDSILDQYEPDKKVQFFLKTNINKNYKIKDQYFRVPVFNFLKEDVISNMGDWPSDKLNNKIFDKPVLVISGKHSNFVKDEYLPIFHHYFTNVKFEEFECGHWVVTDKPQEFITSAVNFIS
ncbi:Alpha/Beta hydrolase protein [Scheffersomyces amazonensis]|uniref:Alpha/Beta hydrolase protein n=1 Tax=Scheffersomyces amazonensis TaxID=1078765 RepID=UPI00315CF8C6